MKTLNPYRLHNTWVFDDAEKNLLQEPFVGGVPEVLDILLASQKIDENEFELTFSGEPFDGFQIICNWEIGDRGGNWYSCRINNEIKRGWLCPALFKYFDSAPKTIYFKVGRANH